MALKLLLAGALALAVKRRMPAAAEAEEHRAFVPGRIDRMVMRPAPIEPSWILNGMPQARISEHSRSGDGASVTAVWDCTAGAFLWHFGWDETVVILEGEVSITAEDGTQRLLRAGDLAYFRGGSWATWRVETYVKKVAFVRRPFPGLMVMAMRMKQALKGGGGARGLAA